jgi:hypothetical protein
LNSTPSWWRFLPSLECRAHAPYFVEPALDGIGKRDLEGDDVVLRFHAEEGRNRLRERGAVERGRLERRHRADRFSLDELALDLEERDEVLVALPERIELLLDAKQLAEEGVDVGRQLEEQRRFVLGGDCGRILAGGDEAVGQGTVALLQPGDKGSVEPDEAVALVEIGKSQAESGTQGMDHRRIPARGTGKECAADRQRLRRKGNRGKRVRSDFRLPSYGKSKARQTRPRSTWPQGTRCRRSPQGTRARRFGRTFPQTLDGTRGAAPRSGSSFFLRLDCASPSRPVARRRGSIQQTIFGWRRSPTSPLFDDEAPIPSAQGA